jgi:hypothetical protein
VFTDSPFALAQAEEQHRDHAVVEQVFADWTNGPLAHMPSIILSPAFDHRFDLRRCDVDVSLRGRHELLLSTAR